MSTKLPYDAPRITVHGDIRALTRAGVSGSAWLRTLLPGQEIPPPEDGMS